MGLFAEINEAGVVLRVVVCDDLAWLQGRLGGKWIETKETDAREQHAGIGMRQSNMAEARFVPEWRRPTSADDAYEAGRWVWHAGKVWKNLTEANTQEPGLAGWRDPVSSESAWVKPAGTHDAYRLNSKVTHAGKRWVNTSSDANVSEPGVFGWTVQAVAPTER